MFWQYKFHWDAELTHHNLDNDMARYVTALLYLTAVEAGGETLLPLADEGMAGLGCAGCEKRPDLRASSRSQGCFECIAPRQDALLARCAPSASSQGTGQTSASCQGQGRVKHR